MSVRLCSCYDVYPQRVQYSVLALLSLFLLTVDSVRRETQYVTRTDYIAFTLGQL